MASGMNVSVRNTRPVPSERKWLERAYSDYLVDLAPLNTGLFPALSEFGHQGQDQLASWFADPNVNVLSLYYGEQPVGFAVALVASHVQLIGGEAPAAAQLNSFLI